MKEIKIYGRVIRGDAYGKKLGFPTANLERRSYARQKQKIKLGVYAGKAEVQGSRFEVQEYVAAIVVGPIDKTGLPKIEAHLLGFKGSLYGKQLTLRLYKYIRPFKKFKTEKELKAQILQDIKIIKNSPISNRL